MIVGFVAGLMYLVQAYRLKHKRLPAQGLRLPSLEWLDRVNSRAIVLSAVLVAAGFLSGIMLNAVNHRHRPTTFPGPIRSSGVRPADALAGRCRGVSAASTSRPTTGGRSPI